MGRRHAKQTKATVGDLQKVSSNESTAKREINWKWMLSLSQQNGPGQQQQHLFVTTNKTNTPKQICKRTHLHMEKPPFAADSLMLMPSWRCVGGWWFLWLSDKYSNSTHQDFFFTFYVNCYQFFIYIHKTTERGVEE